jgi:5-methylcytosine-specific restriction endonuclease McrA
MSKDRTYRMLVGSQRWQRMALEEKVAAGWQCSQCGTVTKRLAVHHRLPVEEARTADEMEARCFDRSNLQVLCFQCHSKVHEALRSRTKSGHRKAEDQRVRRFHQTDLHIDENTLKL